MKSVSFRNCKPCSFMQFSFSQELNPRWNNLITHNWQYHGTGSIKAKWLMCCATNRKVAGSILWLHEVIKVEAVSVAWKGSVGNYLSVIDMGMWRECYGQVMGRVEDTKRSDIRNEPRDEIRIAVANCHTSHGTREIGSQEFTQWPNEHIKTRSTEGHRMRFLFPLHHESVLPKNSE